MNESRRRFPLPLSALAEKSSSGREAASGGRQTAVRNAADAAGAKPSRAAPVAGAAVPQRVQQPLQAQAQAQARTGSGSMVSEAVRKAMVDRVARQGVHDKKVLAALQATPRHMFLEPGMSSQAYIDAALPIGYQQTISQPYIVARMIELLRAGDHAKGLDKVLEIGTGCGYQAAVLSHVAREVYSIERIRALHELAKTNLRPLRIANIRLHYGDGMLGLPQAAPFDGIILAAAGMEVPQALLEQMTIGGRLVAPVGERQQVLQLIERVNRFEWETTTLEACLFVPLRAGVAG